MENRYEELIRKAIFEKEGIEKSAQELKALRIFYKNIENKNKTIIWKIRCNAKMMKLSKETRELLSYTVRIVLFEPKRLAQLENVAEYEEKNFMIIAIDKALKILYDE